MRIKACAYTHPGKCREKNEDNFCLYDRNFLGGKMLRPLRIYVRTKAPVLMGVFDGMGGMRAGEQASYIASQVASGVDFLKVKPQEIEEVMAGICQTANQITCNEMVKTKKGRMGTTTSMLCFYEDRFTLCNIGDSPIFLFRDHILKEISFEHTEKQNFIRLYGVDNIPPKKKFALTQYVGIFPDEMEIEPYILTEPVCEDDRFLICSDGLTDMVDEREIAQVMESRFSTGKTVKTLLNMALENGGKDNTTIICADIKK